MKLKVKITHYSNNIKRTAERLLLTFHRVRVKFPIREIEEFVNFKGVEGPAHESELIIIF